MTNPTAAAPQRNKLYGVFRNAWHRITEHPQLKGTHKGHRVEPQTQHRTTLNPNPMSDSGVQMLPEL